VCDLGLLLPAVGRSQASFDDQDLDPDLFIKVIELIESLICNHILVGGNQCPGNHAWLFGLEIYSLPLLKMKRLSKVGWLGY
jgi:hypothetical protein